MVLAEIYTGIQYVIGAGIAQARDWTLRKHGSFSTRDKIFLSPGMFGLSCDTT